MLFYQHVEKEPVRKLLEPRQSAGSKDRLDVIEAIRLSSLENKYFKM
jgi:hypothetical protein